MVIKYVKIHRSIPVGGEGLKMQRQKIAFVKPIQSFEPLVVNNREYLFCECSVLPGTCTMDFSKIPQQYGVYVFWIARDFVLNFTKFNAEVTGLFKKGNEEYAVVVSVPPYNGSIINEKWTLKKDRIFYVGSTSNLRHRIQEHMESDVVDNSVSLKLGFSTRQHVKKYLKVLWLSASNKDYKKIETDIRKEYGSYFGK